MKNAIWIGRRQVKGLIILLALLPLVPAGFLLHTMWLHSATDKVRVADETNAAFGNQLRLSSERFSTATTGDPRGQQAIIQFLRHVFGASLPMKITSNTGKIVYQSQTPLTGNQISYRIDAGEFEGWNIEIDSVTEIPLHVIEEQKSAIWQAIFTLVGTMLIACGVWMVVNRGLKTDEIRKDLITTISHEIKTPVSAIKILAESLQGGELDESLQAEYISLITSENERIEQLANRFLTYGRLEKGQMPIGRAPILINLVVDEVAKLLAPNFQAAAGQITIQGEADLTVLGDTNSLTILITNLLENALKYGGSPPLVLVNLARNGPQVVVSITDNGEGIPKPEQSAVFRPFYRSSGRLDDGQTGVGLGLSICHRITKLMKGSLILKTSENPSYPGAEFQIRLPASP